MALLDLDASATALLSSLHRGQFRIPPNRIPDCPLNADATRIARDDALSGRAYESFAAMELARLLPHTEAAPAMRHWRGAHGEEVDVVLEDRTG